MSALTDFNDLANVRGLDAVRETVEDARPVADTPLQDGADVRLIGENWPDYILPGQNPVPDIPPDVLPSWVARMAGAVAESTQTPSAMAVMCSISVLATCLHRRFEVGPYGEDDDYTEPVSIWTLTGMGSGNRKTSVINSLSAPLVRWEKLERDRLRPEIARNAAGRLVSKKRIEKLTKDAVNAENDEERERLRKLIEDEENTIPPEIIAPRLYTNDVTAERLQALLVEHGERMSVLSDEAGIFVIMAGLYSGGMASLDVFLQGHAGTPMRVDRAGRSAHVDKPAVTFGLALQPDVLEEVAGSRRFRGSGLLARFLYTMPDSTVGKRDVRQRLTIPRMILNEYESRIFGLLEGRELTASAPRVIGMTDEARECWLDLAEEIESKQGEHGELESICDWSSKLPGAAARIAALFELAESGVNAPYVGLKSTAAAVRLCRLLIPHARAAFGLLGADSVDTNASAIVKWARGARMVSFSRRECQKAMEGRFRSVAPLEKAIERLVLGDVAKVEKRQNKGAPPTTMIRMNPKLFVD